MIAVPVQTAAQVLAAAAATLHQPDQAENQVVQQNTNQAAQKAGKKWILKHS